MHSLAWLPRSVASSFNFSGACVAFHPPTATRVPRPARRGGSLSAMPPSPSSSSITSSGPGTPLANPAFAVSMASGPFDGAGLLRQLAGHYVQRQSYKPSSPHPPTYAPLVDPSTKPRHGERSRPRLGIRASIVYTPCVIPQPRPECPSFRSPCASPNSCCASCCSCCPSHHSRRAPRRRPPWACRAPWANSRVPPGAACPERAPRRVSAPTAGAPRIRQKWDPPQVKSFLEKLLLRARPPIPSPTRQPAP